MSRRFIRIAVVCVAVCASLCQSSLYAQKQKTFQQFVDITQPKFQRDAWGECESIVVDNADLARTDDEWMYYHLVRAWVCDCKYNYTKDYNVVPKLIRSLEYITTYYFDHLAVVEGQGQNYWAAAAQLAWLYDTEHDARIQAFSRRAEAAFAKSVFAVQNADQMTLIRQHYDHYMQESVAAADDSLAMMVDAVGSISTMSEARLQSLINFFVRYRPVRCVELTQCINELYSRMRDHHQYDQSLALLQQGISVIQSAPLTPRVGGCLAVLRLQLGENYYYQKQYNKSVSAIDEAMNVFCRDSSLLMFWIRCNIDKAKALNRMGRVEQARSLAHLAEKQCSECDASMRQTTLWMSYISNLAELALEWQDSEQSIRLSDEILSDDTNRSLHGAPYTETACLRACMALREHDYATVVRLLLPVTTLDSDDGRRKMAYHLLVYAMICSHHPQATTYLKSMLVDAVDGLDAVLWGMGMAERDVYWNVAARSQQYLALMQAWQNGDDESLTSAYEQVLFCRTLMQAIYHATEQSSRRSQSAVCDANRELHKQLERLPTVSPEDADAVLHKVDSLYKSVMRHVYLESGFDMKPSATLRQDGEAAVEFVVVATPDSTSGYGAMVVTPASPCPRLVWLCPVADISDEDLCRRRDVHRLYSGESLYNKIWRPLEPLLKDAQVVYYAPFGPLERINFEAISHEGCRLGDAYRMHRLVSTAYVGQMKSRAPIRCNSAVLYADMTNDLPNTRDEVDSVASLLSGRGVRCSIRVGRRATVASVDEGLGQEPSLLYFAGHGFYSPRVESDSADMTMASVPITDLQMAESGISMADGRLTALRLCHRDLSGIRVAVLSACRSGVASSDPVEGSLGMVRGLKMGGADVVVSTLWDVEEQRCVDFVATFLDHYLAGCDIAAARNAAVDAMRRFYPQFADWAAFIVTE